MNRYLFVSAPLSYDPKGKIHVMKGTTLKGSPTRTLMKEAIYLAKQRRKMERKQAKQIAALKK